MTQSSDKTTHFGFQDIPWHEKANKVADVFHSVADKYDLMNDLMSLGIHRLWKRYAIELSGVKQGQKVLDVAAGTGDLSLQFSRLVGQSGQVFVSDINSSMLNQGRDRLTNEGVIGNVEYVQANAENLPFADNQFDCLTIAFGLRNVTDKQKALASMYRIIKPGGRVLILEFSHLTVDALKPLYDFYSFKLLPKIGEFIANDAESYRYLAESIRMHPNQDSLKSMMEKAGFEDVDVHNLSAGIAAVHRAYKY